MGVQGRPAELEGPAQTHPSLAGPGTVLAPGAQEDHAVGTVCPGPGSGCIWALWLGATGLEEPPAEPDCWGPQARGPFSSGCTR